MMSILTKALSALPVVGSVLGSAFNANQQEKQNRRSENFAREMYGKQRSDSLSDWNMQNAYNDPSAQMQRLKDAELNPNLVYGHGADAQSTAPVRSSQAQTPTFKAPQVDAGGIVQNAMMMKQIQSNIAKTEAETARIQADTQSQLYANKMLTPQMFETEYQHRLAKGTFGTQNEESNASIRQLEAETQALLSGYQKDYSPINENNPKASSNLSVDKMTAQIQSIAEQNEGIALTNKLKEYEMSVISALGLSGNHAGQFATFFSNLLKLALLKIK